MKMDKVRTLAKIAAGAVILWYVPLEWLVVGFGAWVLLFNEGEGKDGVV